MTRWSCHASRICANVRSSISSRKSTPMISAPSAGDNGRTASAPTRVPEAECGTVVSIGNSRLLGVDQDEGDTAGFIAAIYPGVVGALLHQNIASLEMDF